MSYLSVSWSRLIRSKVVHWVNRRAHKRRPTAPNAKKFDCYGDSSCVLYGNDMKLMRDIFMKKEAQRSLFEQYAECLMKNVTYNTSKLTTTEYDPICKAIEFYLIDLINLCIFLSLFQALWLLLQWQSVTHMMLTSWAWINGKWPCVPFLIPLRISKAHRTCDSEKTITQNLNLSGYFGYISSMSISAYLQRPRHHS